MESTQAAAAVSDSTQPPTQMQMQVPPSLEIGTQAYRDATARIIEFVQKELRNTGLLDEVHGGLAAVRTTVQQLFGGGQSGPQSEDDLALLAAALQQRHAVLSARIAESGDNFGLTGEQLKFFASIGSQLKHALQPGRVANWKTWTPVTADFLDHLLSDMEWVVKVGQPRKPPEMQQSLWFSEDVLGLGVGELCSIVDCCSIGKVDAERREEPPPKVMRACVQQQHRQQPASCVTYSPSRKTTPRACCGSTAM